MSRGDPGPLDPPSEELLASILDRMAHQIKNPLQAVTVNLEVVRMRVRREAPEVWPDVERFAEAVDANARLLHRRLQLVLAMARRSTDDAEEPVDLRALIDDVVGALRFGEEGPKVRVEGAERGEVGVASRVGYLVELVVRLLDAARAAAPGPSVELRVTIAEHDGRAALELSAGGADGPPAGCADLAVRAGGELVRRDAAAGTIWRLELPRA